MIITDYPIGVKREIVNALKPVFGASYPDENLAEKVAVSLEFPMEQVHYPAVYVTFSSGPLQNVGVGHTEIDEDSMTVIRHFKFTGTVRFNVMALNPVDRDMVAAGLTQLLTIGKTYPHFQDFYDQMMDGDYIGLQALTDEITVSEDMTSPVPWNDDEQLIYAKSFSFPVLGEFAGDEQTGDLIQISKVNLYPYIKGNPKPTGTVDPSPWS